MKTICLYFEIHQNIHLKRYRFFDIGTDHYYYDDYENERSITETAEKSYIPALKTLIEMVRESKGYFKCALSISGTALELLEQYAPQVIELLTELIGTGKVEVLAEPYAHSLSSLANEDSFRDEVQHLMDHLSTTFGVKPTILRNSCLIYNDDIAQIIQSMGFKGVLTEGAKHILGWKSPHYVYQSAAAPKLKMLLRDYSLSEDISYRFANPAWSAYPLFADTYMDWIAALPEEEQVIGLFMELCALGIFQPLSSGILPFMKQLVNSAKERGITFSTPSEILKTHKPVDSLAVGHPISWVDEERDISAWLGNDMQQEAFNKLYSVADKVRLLPDRRLRQDWDYLQATNNFRFMSTKSSATGGYRGIYDNAYDAFTNYMNIIADFITRVNSHFPDVENEELASLMAAIRNQQDELTRKDKEIEKLKNTVQHLQGGAPKPVRAPRKKAAEK